MLSFPIISPFHLFQLQPHFSTAAEALPLQWSPTQTPRLQSDLSNESPALQWVIGLKQKYPSVTLHFPQDKFRVFPGMVLCDLAHAYLHLTSHHSPSANCLAVCLSFSALILHIAPSAFMF